MPEIFEVYFYKSPPSTSLGDFLFNKGNKDYHRMYGFSGEILHLAVRFGTKVYEVTEEGTKVYPWREELLDDLSLVGFYTLDIREFSTDKKLAAVFTLENCVGRKLNIGRCLSYLWQSVGFHKSDRRLEYMGSVSQEDMLNLPSGSYVRKGRKEKFCLPYTCATLVNIVLNRLFDYEPSYTGHLAQSTAMSLSVFAELGWGTVYELDI